MFSIEHLFRLSSVFTCAIFAGAAIYINVAEHPARMEVGTRLAATVFPGSYKRAAAMQAPLAVICLISSIVSWLLGSSIWWLIAGIMVGAVVPFTIIVIMPTNKQLLNPKVDKDSPHTKALLEKWGKLHAVRTVLTMAAFVIFLLNM